jgi:deoxyribodipyrimidine photo-lyase
MPARGEAVIATSAAMNSSASIVETERLKMLNRRDFHPKGAFVLYWMQQAQRAEWNHALEYAVELANERRLPTLVVFGLTDRYPEANARHYRFLLNGLQETADTLKRRGIGFVCRRGDPDDVVLRIARGAAAVVADAGYMPIQKRWREKAARSLSIPLIQVETDVVAPVEAVSDHEEYAARTIRPKIHKLLPRFLRPVRAVPVHVKWRGPANFSNDWKNADAVFQSLEKVDRSVAPVPGFRGGLSEARRLLRHFIRSKLADYPDARNEPAGGCQSGMSAYLHFGQISPLEVAWSVQAAEAPRRSKEAFLEELIVRRELSMNFAHYRADCEQYSAVPEWARRTLERHARDRRAYLYTEAELENAATHDRFWNAAQTEMVRTGKMHNYMRMYWGKKIIEWTRTPEEAFKIALRLNNRYEMDGRDPNSCAGVAWCFGKHDRPWAERPIFGTVRYMSCDGLTRKFDMEAYVAMVSGAV